MRNVVWLVLLFTAAVVAAVTFGRNDGLVSIFWAPWRVDLSLNIFLLGLLLAGGLALVAVQAVIGLVRLPQRAAQWRALRRERGANRALREALAEFFSARYSRAHKAALRALELQAEDTGDEREFAVLAQLLAAGSLHRLSDRLRRDDQLQRLTALLDKPDGLRRADDGALLMAAEWALDDRDADRAMALLADLPPGVARRTQALRLRLRAARLAGQPLDALQTARLLAKHQAFSIDVARGLLRSLAIEALQDVHDMDQLRRVWSSLDDEDRQDPHVVAHAAEQSARLGGAADGRGWLLPQWQQLGRCDDDARERLAQALVQCVEGLGPEWLPTLEAAQRQIGQHAAVQVAVGMAFAERQLWGKARSLLESAARAPALSAALRRRAWLRLASMARNDADEARAVSCEQAAAALLG